MSGDGKLLESELSPLEFKRLTAACRRDAFSCRERRMVFAPLSAVFKTKPVSEKEALVLSEGNWGSLTHRQKFACRGALAKKFPDREIVFA
jgi:hypothetical protein